MACQLKGNIGALSADNCQNIQMLQCQKRFSVPQMEYLPGLSSHFDSFCLHTVRCICRSFFHRRAGQGVKMDGE